MRILNLYAGIGGNRALWGDEHEITAVENVPHIADTYRKLWPNDTVIEVDAHQYLLDHYREFDFIWSSPPCPTHSRMNLAIHSQGHVRYPDMTLYQEIIFLKHFCRAPWVVENVIPYYKPLIAPTAELDRHLLWSNFHISKMRTGRKINIAKATERELAALHRINIPTVRSNRKLLRNAVIPELGLHIFNCRDNLKQEVLL